MGRVADATAPAPTTEMGSCHRNPSTCMVMPQMVVGTGRPRPSAAVPALLRLVVVPCLNAHKRPVRDPLYLFNSLLTVLVTRRQRP